MAAVLSKGQVNSSPYRFLANCGGFVWAETQATVLYSKTSQPEAIVCLNFILRCSDRQRASLSFQKRRRSDEAAALTFLLVVSSCSAVEQPDMVFSVEQTRCSLLPKTEPSSPERAAEDSGISDTWDSDGEDAGSSAKLLLKLTEKPEELLQLPDGGDGVAPALTAGEPAVLTR